MIEIHQARLANGVAVVVGHAPHAATASIGAFVRWGSAHESPRLAGIGHVLEHMAFKGTAGNGRARDARQLNLAAEMLGAEVNAHTDKDHTAYYMRALPEHTGALLRLLAEIVLQPSLPEHELERERQVLLQEFAEDEDDPVATAFKLFDKACFGTHPAAQPVMGSRRNLERFTRADLLEHRRHGYTAPNVVIGAFGPMPPEPMLRAAEDLFAALPPGAPNLVDEPAYRGGVLTRGQPGSSQSHLVIGFPVPALRADSVVAGVAAAVLGEGMSSPLLDRVREQRGLAYYAACSADVLDMCGQFVIEASTAPGQLDELLAEVVTLLRQHAARVDPQDLQRARSQLLLRERRRGERALRWLEAAALELFALGRVHGERERLERIEAVTAAELRRGFETMLGAGASLAVTGQVARGLRHRLAPVLERLSG